MERASGRDLDALVEERGPLPVDEALEYVRQLCVVIAEAHAHGIVHRDIKPGNVLVGSGPTGEPTVKLVDFGIAKEDRPPGDHSGLTAVSALLGTPEYMSPEQLRSSRDVDCRSDIWSLGATLFFMLTGTAPFEAEHLSDLVERIQHGATPSIRSARPDVPQHLETVLARCLHRDPYGRFKSVGDLAAALSTFRSSGRLPSVATPNEPFEPTQIMPVPSDDFHEATPTSVSEHTVALALAPASLAHETTSRRSVSLRGSGPSSSPPQSSPQRTPISASPSNVVERPPAYRLLVLAVVIGLVAGGVLATAVEHALRHGAC
jgi:serine/threonine-protein kinase